MGKLKLEKEKQASELSDMISRASFVVFTDFKGLNVAEVTELRVKLRKAKVEYHVVKNTLLKRSINNSDIEQYLNSPTAIALSYQDQ